MKKLTAALSLAFLLGAAMPVVLSGGQNVSAQEDEQQSSEQEQQQQPGASYRYTAQPGDSYTLMARKAVQTYGLKHDVSLSLAQIIYAETKMTQEAGSPSLEEGQDVEIAESAVQQWVERAQELPEEAEAGWDYYAQFANFNTDSVGESR